MENARSFFDRALSLLRRKNSDYSSKDDALRNLKSSAALGIDPRVALLCRMQDKMGRLSTLIAKKADVKDESIQDTAMDLANYAFLFTQLQEQNNEQL